MSPCVPHGFAVVLGHHLGDRGAGRVGLQLHHPGVPDQGDVGVLQGGPDAGHLGVGLGVQRTREAVAGPALHADAVRQVRLVDPDAARRVERVKALRGQVVGELLDPRFVGDRRVRVGRAGRRFGRILAPRAVHLVHRLGGGVVRLHVLVGDGPGGRQAVVVAQFAEVLLAHPVQRGAVQLGRAADEVMHLRLEERLGLRVVPAVRARCTGRRRTRPRSTSSPARGAASRRARAAECACLMGRGGGRGCRRLPRYRSR